MALRRCSSRLLCGLVCSLLKLFAVGKLNKTHGSYMTLLTTKFTKQILKRNITFMSFVIGVTTIVAQRKDRRSKGGILT
jgi:hypothetical protein